jgi:hypothetical protein
MTRVVESNMLMSLSVFSFKHKLKALHFFGHLFNTFDLNLPLVLVGTLNSKDIVET